MSANKLWIFGWHAVLSLLQHQPERALRLCVLKERQDGKIKDCLLLAQKNHLAVEYVTREALDRLTDDANHQGIAVYCLKPPAYDEHDLNDLLSAIDGSPFLLILDGVQDPHNLGACFRVADAAGVHAIITPKDKSVGLTATVSKVASGAAERVPFVQVTNLARVLQQLKEKGIWIYGAAGEAKQTLYQTELSGPIAIVLGAEGTGLRRLTQENCDGLLRIPMLGSVASLNVSVATGVFLFEVVRQRKQ